MSVVDFADIVLAALERRASDIHLTAGAAPSIRVRGRLFALEGFPILGVSDTREIVYSIMSDTQRQMFENARQVDFSYSVPRTARMRVNAYLQRGAVSAALRVIPSEIKSLQALGMPDSVHEMANLPRGIVLITGPTGSGKSTTQAALIGHINRTFRRGHVLTLEDPIEYVHAHNLSAGSTSARSGWDTDELQHRPPSHAAREDPDVVLVGEMRDAESMQTTLSIAAETGHLVFATLHTNDTATALDRIIDVIPPPREADQVRVQLAAALLGVVAQQLLPTADGSGRVRRRRDPGAHARDPQPDP